MHRIVAACLLLCLLSWLPEAAIGEPLHVRATNGELPLAAHVEVLEDADGRLDIAAIRSPEQAARFVPNRRQGDLNLGYSASAWWLRITLRPDSGAGGLRLVEVAFPTLDRIEFFAPDSQTPLVAGDQRPFAERPLRHRHFVFPVVLREGEVQTLHLRIQSSGSLTIPLTIWTPSALHLADQDAYAAHALYYGMLLALGLYNLLLWFVLRDRNYLAYVAFVAAMAVGQLAQGGIGYQYLWPDAVVWESIAFSSGYAATGFFGALFTRLFLDTRRHHARLDRLIVLLAAGFALATLAPLLIPYRLAAIVTSLLGIGFSAVAVISAIVCLRRGDAGARFFLVAWTLLLAGVAIMGLRNMALLPTNFFTANGIQIGSALEMLLLSFALADRIHLLRRDKERAQQEALVADRARISALTASERELEARVEARTQELAAANVRLVASETRLREMAHHDPLTGLPNRTLLFDRIGQAIQRARRNGDPFALLLVDLDGFKQVNDSFGHEAGDQVLIAVATRMRECVRAVDTVARLGGDEFVVLVENAKTAEAARATATKLVDALRGPFAIGSQEANIGASVGVALWPTHGEDAPTLLLAADRAMYAAKRAGRNGVMTSGDAGAR